MPHEEILEGSGLGLIFAGLLGSFARPEQLDRSVVTFLVF